MIKIEINQEFENKEEMASALNYIAGLLEMGYTSGFNPNFQLKVVTTEFQKTVDEEYDDGQGRKYDILDDELR